jgi:selenocysteine lyase/cysteine desulfurase
MTDTTAITRVLPVSEAFDIPEGVAYLNCAYMGPLPRAAVAAGREGIERKARPWRIDVPDFFAPVERARGLFAGLVGGDPEGVCLVPSVSYGTALAAANLPLANGRTIVVLEDEFPSNFYVWRDVADRTGAEIVSVARPPDDGWTAAIEAAVDDRCAIVATPACHWTDGTLVDLERVGARARSVGAALVVDACQAAGAFPLDVGRIRPDFLVTAGYKWLLGPYTTGFCWVAPDRRSGRPLEHNWITRAGSDDFAGLVDYTDELAPGARRYDMGEVSNFAALPALIASLELLAAFTPETVAAHARGLTTRIADGAAALGLRVPAPEVRAPHLVGLGLVPGVAAPTVAAQLRERDVHVSVRGRSVRVSAHVFNTPADVDRFLEALEVAVS